MVRQLEIQSTPPRKKQRLASSDSGVSSHLASPAPPKETFEKRPRHKTREDKYEPKKKEKEEKNRVSEGKSSRKKREKSGDRRKAAKKAGDELIQNFSSKNIAQDRLTIRPSNGLGLFNNGRASSPARRRGLPDLAFSEMEFLQHSRSNQHSGKENPVVSRSREKERKKASRAQDEISTFFGPNRAPLQDVSSNRSGPSVDVVKKGPNVYTRQLDYERDGTKRRVSEAIDSRSETSRGSEVAGRSFDRHQVGHNYDPSPEVNRSINILGSTSRVSGNATTYVSWSESQRSPVSTPHHDNFDQRNISLTPESVRRSLEKTGIFSGTGIGRTLSSHWTNRPPGVYGIRDLMAAQDTRCGNSSDLMSTELTGSSGSVLENPPNHQQDRDRVSPDLSRRKARDVLPARQKRADQALSTDQNESVDQQGTSRKRIFIEHFDPALGWREDPNIGQCSQQTSAATMRPKDSHIPPPTPLTREEIARTARIKIPKRPSTTVPVLPDTRNETRLPFEVEEDRRIPMLKTDGGHPVWQESHRATSPRVSVNSIQRPLMSRASNPTLPTIYEDTEEQAASHGAAPLPENQPGSQIGPQASQSRLNMDWNNTPIRVESQLQRQDQGSCYHAEHTINQGEYLGGRNVTYLGLPMTGAWLGTSSNTTSIAHGSLRPIAGGQSLYVRQMQQPPTFSQRDYNGSSSAVGEASWKPSSVASLAYDGKYGYGHQQRREDLAENAYAIDQSNDPGVCQTYEQGLNDVHEDCYNELGSWNAEIRDVDPSFHDMREDQNHVYFDHEHIAPEHFAAPHPESYHGIEYDEYEPLAVTHQNGSWQSRHF